MPVMGAMQPNLIVSFASAGEIVENIAIIPMQTVSATIDLIIILLFMTYLLLFFHFVDFSNVSPSLPLPDD